MKEDSVGTEAPRKRLTRFFNPFAGGLRSASRVVRTLLLLTLVYFLAAIPICLIAYYGAFTPMVDLRPAAVATADQKAAVAKPAPGVIFTDSLIVLADQLLDGWLPNDKFWPTVLLDNPQNFQLGQLEVIRDSVRVLRDKLSRQRTTDKIDPLVDRAFADFNINADSWIFPSAEGSYSDAVKALKDYRARLKTDKAHFFPRADNLIELLDQLASRLGGATQRLGNAPRDLDVRLSEETAGDRYSEGEKMTKVRVPWTKIDDHFYYARGVSYALYAVMTAIDHEFTDVITIKRSREMLQNIIAELRLANFEPLMVQNGGRDSIWANHSLTLMATLESVRQKMLDLKQILER